MGHRFNPAHFLPPGLTVDRVEVGGEVILLTVHSGALSAACPVCGEPSGRVQSRYVRRAADLPLGGRRVELQVSVRRFRCDEVRCKRQIFAERFASDVLPAFARRTGRLDRIVHHLALALGGRPGESLARRLMLPVSRTTLLRVVRRRYHSRPDPLSVIGIDDFAWRRNHRYGTLVCDLERRRIVTLLPDREPATAAAWLKERPSIGIVARDRGGGYAEAVTRALPDATQVADRWHLMENASRAFLDAVRRSMRGIREVIGATQLDPALLTAAERLQYEGYRRREETNAAVHELVGAGVPIKAIRRQTGLSRGLIRAIVRGERTDVFCVRQSSLEPYLPWLDGRWDEGCRNATALWRELRSRGFSGSLRVIGEWATRRRRAEMATAAVLQRVPSARTVARFMTTSRERLTRSEAVTVAAIEDGVPALVEAREEVARFQAMVRAMAPDRLEPWLEEAGKGLLASFARGVVRDLAAVRAALTLPWSNGQTEGQITKLKLVKRQMYGRGKIDLLQARLIGAHP